MESEEKRSSSAKKYLILTLEIIILIGVMLVTAWLVKKFKKPGQMTVIESQAMDMTVMVPPRGSTPVSTATAFTKYLKEKASTYGTVIAYNEVDIFPRVTGRLVYMPFYPGDRVDEGELLAELDSVELSSRANEAAWGVRVASGEKNAMREMKKSLSYEREAVLSEEKAAQAELQDMRAELAYWKAEFERSKTLYSEGAISKDEFQMTEAKYRSTLAKEEGAKNMASSAQNKAHAIKHQESATAADLEKQGSAVEQALAMENTARIVQGYTRIQAPFQALVTKRLVAPGTLVTPGVAILRLVDSRKVRIQAVLSERDMSYVREGNSLEYALPGSPVKWRTAKITSLFPSVDPKARTGIVEAIVYNDDGKLLPGAFVHVRVTTRQDASALVVPTKAVVHGTDVQNRPGVFIIRDEGRGEVTQYFCSMHPEVVSDKPGKCPKCNMDLTPKQTAGGLHAYLTVVRIGLSDGEYTQILEGVKDGDMVAIDGIEDLQSGATVTPTKWGPGGPEELPPPPGGSMPGHEHGAGKPAETPSHEGHPSPAGKRVYTCPMHPEVVSDKPADCPKCGMKLEAK